MILSQAKFYHLARELADAKSANAAMRDNVEEKQALIDGLIAENAEIKTRIGRLTTAYETALRIANENRKMGSVIMH